MRILVTGGAGFIGSAFVHRRLAQTNDHVSVLDKLTYAGTLANLDGLESAPATRDRFRFVKGDICDAALVGELMADQDAVVNFAAESHVDRSILDAAAFLSTGIVGVHTLLEATRAETERRAGGRGVRFLQVSTDEVYGSVADGESRESDMLDPRSPYSAVKAAGELLARAYHATHGLDVVITRGANTYGPHQHPEKLVSLFITNALCDQSLPLYGDGLQRRNWLFVDDHADAVSLVLDRGEGGETYNVPGPDERTNRDVTEAILGQLGKPWSLVRSVPDRPGHDRRYAMDGSKIAALGWAPRVGFDEGLQQTVAWYVDNEGWWRTIRDAEWADYYGRQYDWRLERSVGA
ncbi:MAG TPA: dTDP-glucose 4,6-dehydratase [Candidatus Limnocylindrales bacterium]